MRIGEICRLSGLTKDAVRFYEKQGLIQVPRKDLRFNNYKEYSPDTLQRLLVIKRLKDFGFTLKEAAQYLELIDHHQASCNNVSHKIAEKVLLIEARIAELQAIKQLMVTGIEDCLSCHAPEDRDENCPILTSVAP